MKLCVAQTKPERGNIECNIKNHLRLVELAITNGADTIIFPELSITGYELELAKELATDANDKRFDVFQKVSDENKITIGIGAPTKNGNDVCISMIIFHPNALRQTYSKKYIHSSEEPFFVAGINDTLLLDNSKIAPAICYEVSVAEHAGNAYNNGAEIYMASIVEDKGGVERSHKKLAAIAQKYSMTVLMANAVGAASCYDCGGRSAVWNNKGELLDELNENSEGILILETEMETIFKQQL